MAKFDVNKKGYDTEQVDNFINKLTVKYESIINSTNLVPIKSSKLSSLFRKIKSLLGANVELQ